MTNERFVDLEQKLLNLNQFKMIAKEVTKHIEILENSIEHVKFIRSANTLPFSPKIFLSSITTRERNLLYHCGKGVEIDEAILLLYNRKNFKSDKLKLKLTEKACIDVVFLISLRQHVINICLKILICCQLKKHLLILIMTKEMDQNKLIQMIERTQRADKKRRHTGNSGFWQIGEDGTPLRF